MSEQNIYQKLLAITKEAEQIPKNGFNEFSKYKYVKAVDALGAIKKLLIKHGIHLAISETECKRYRDGKNFHTEIKVTAKFINIDNPKDFHETTYFSVSADTLDKDIFKAKTNGLKYLFTQEFKLVTDDFIDTEQGGNHELQPVPISKAQAKNIEKLIKDTGADETKFMLYLKNTYGTARVEDLSTEDAEQAILTLKAKLEFNKKEKASA